MDSVPGAKCRIRLPAASDYQEVLLFGSSIWRDDTPDGIEIEINKGYRGIIHDEGLILFGIDNVMVNVKRVKMNGRMRLASALDQVSQQADVQYTIEEKEILDSIKNVWELILNIETDDETDFFASGAGSMDVVRLVEEVKDLVKTELENEDVFMNPTLGEFCTAVILRLRGVNNVEEIKYKGVELVANGMSIKVPCQLFINGKFVDAENGYSIPTVNPTDESVICDVQCGSVKDVDKAVKAAKKAFDRGEWSKISARERGQYLYK